ncbi:MAG TPA: hypothetical protein VHB21_09455 [Minicystis sp.]|nr:hypothetical protein [Minicystis sp.]
MAAAIQDGELSTPPEDSGYVAEFGALPKSPTKQISLVVFNDFITDAGSSTVYSNPLLGGLLGAFDQMAIEMVTDRATVTLGTLTMSAQIEHSGDARAFTPKAASPEVLAATVSTTTTTTFQVGFDDGSLPSLAFVRIAFACTATTTFSVRMKCTVTLNNAHERAFTRKLVAYSEQYIIDDDVGNCESWMAGGTSFIVEPCWTRRGTKFSDEPRINKLTGDFTPSLFPYFLMDGQPMSSSSWSTCGEHVVTLKDDYRACFRKNGSMVIFRGKVPVAESAPASFGAYEPRGGQWRAPGRKYG